MYIIKSYWSWHLRFPLTFGFTKTRSKLRHLAACLDTHGRINQLYQTLFFFIGIRHLFSLVIYKILVFSKVTIKLFGMISENRLRKTNFTFNIAFYFPQ